MVYLMKHESDISNGIEDFGELREIFIFLFKREPEVCGHA